MTTRRSGKDEARTLSRVYRIDNRHGLRLDSCTAAYLPVYQVLDAKTDVSPLFVIAPALIRKQLSPFSIGPVLTIVCAQNAVECHPDHHQNPSSGCALVLALALVAGWPAGGMSAAWDMMPMRRFLRRRSVQGVEADHCVNCAMSTVHESLL